MKKMNNKGFSLVELIVVVLIMAIIAVALAPQVMKWVENSRKSTDASNYDTIVSAANIALSDEDTLHAITSGGAAIVIEASSTTREWKVGTITADVTSKPSSGAANFLAYEMGKTLGTGWMKALAAKAATLDYITDAGVTGSSGDYQVTVNANGTVTRTHAPYNPNS